MKKTKSKQGLSSFFSDLPTKIKWFLYDINLAIYNFFTRNGKLVKNKTMNDRKKEEIFFLMVILVYPISLFLLGYVYVNLRSILLSFQTYNFNDGNFYWEGLANIKKVFLDLTKDPILSKITIRSLISYSITLLVAFPLNLIFAFIIYKKIPLAGFFQVVLFLPSIISSLVISLMFKQFVDYAIPIILTKLGVANPPNLLFDYNTAFKMQVFFVIWTGFGSQLILYSGAMSRIPETLIEVGELEGLSMIKEFWYITLPMIYQTITIFLITGVAGIFTSQLALFSFYGTSAPTEIHVLGYYFFVKVVGQGAAIAEYPYAAAGGLIFTFVAAPITLLVRHFLEKYGPSVEF